MITTFARSVLCLALALPVAAAGQSSTNSPATNAPTATNPVVTTTAITNVTVLVSTNTAAPEHRGIGSSTLGSSIGSFGGGGVEVQRSVSYTITTTTTNAASTNAAK